MTTLFMRRKLEHLLRTSAIHADAECDRHADDDDAGDGEGGVGQARVVKVERVENPALWRRYAAKRNQLRASLRSRNVQRRTVEGSRPIRCEMAADERWLFHGTQPERIPSICDHGLAVPPEDQKHSNGLRFGHGIYFTDQSCKAHQYAAAEADFNDHSSGGRTFQLLYCR